MTTLSLTSRPWTGDPDFVRIAELMNTCEAVDQVGWGASADELRAELELVDKARNLRLWEDGDGRLVGYADLQPAESDGHLTATFFLLVDPQQRGRGLEQEIMGWGWARLREMAEESGLPARLKTYARDDDGWRVPLYEALGEPARLMWRMRRDLTEPIPAAVFPEGYTPRPLRSDELAAWTDLYNQSFIDHWDHHPMSIEQAATTFRNETCYRPELDIVVEAPDGSLAAFCLSTINDEEIERTSLREGGIRLLGTRRGERGKGLGRAALLRGMRLLREAGMESAFLGVDSDSQTGATRLYQSVGFRKAHCFMVWLVDLERQ